MISRAQICKRNMIMLVAAILLTNSFVVFGWDKQAAYKFIENSVENGLTTFAGQDENLSRISHVIPVENFSLMVVLDLLASSNLSIECIQKILAKIMSVQAENGLFTCFVNKSLLPADVDSTCLALTASARIGAPNERLTRLALEAVTQNTNKEGLLEVYLDKDRSGRIDFVVCANALYCAYFFGCGSKMKQVEEYVYKVLVSEEYKGGSLYYPSEDTYLYMVARLLDFHELKIKFAGPLREKIMKRIGTTDNALDLALRIICAKKVDIVNACEVEKLKELQQVDGGWPIHSFFKNGKSKNTYNYEYSQIAIRREEYYGNREIVTAFAIKALAEAGA